MTSAQKRRNAWLAALFIVSPLVWTIPTFFYLRSKSLADSALCSSSLMTHGLGLIGYAQNHGGVLPDAKNWIQATKAGEREMLKCPADPDESRSVSYAMNANLSGKKLSEIKNPSQVILLYETASKQNTPAGTGQDLVDIGKEKSGQGRHNKVGYRFNYFVMADGSIRKAGTPDEKKPLRWTP